MYILAIDQGTTGTTATIFDRKGNPVGRAYREITQKYPRPGWVEHDPEEIWSTVNATVDELGDGIKGKIKAVGIANQRETTVLWDRKTGKPVHNAVVWQCRRTAEMCESYRTQENIIQEKTGLPLDAYFSATKLRWLLDNSGIRDDSDLVFGTIDSWLIWKLTGGKAHATDCTNASRTMLYNIGTKSWDDELVSMFGIPRHILPTVKYSIDDYNTVELIPVLQDVPIRGAAGDQQAALFGQTCFRPGQAKNTYGTGSFLIMNTGERRTYSRKGLASTLAVDGSGRPCYALEGSVFIAGAAIQWLRDELKIIRSAAESDALARSLDDNGGVYIVPAFTGLGAPHWDMEARGILTGLTRGAGVAHIVRAALEAMAYQSDDVLRLMEEESGTPIESLRVDGGAAANDFLMQFQANISGRPVVRPKNIESTSLGAAMLAGLGAGFWSGPGELETINELNQRFEPNIGDGERARLLNGWRKAVRQARSR